MPVAPPLTDVAVGAVNFLVVEASPPLSPAKPGIARATQPEGRSLDQSNSVLDHLGLLSSSPRFASMDRETEMSTLFSSLTPVLDAPAV